VLQHRDPSSNSHNSCSSSGSPSKVQTASTVSPSCPYSAQRSRSSQLCCGPQQPTHTSRQGSKQLSRPSSCATRSCSSLWW
jgi:hypothetical protein